VALGGGKYISIYLSSILIMLLLEITVFRNVKIYVYSL